MENKLVTFMVIVLFLFAGIITAPFSWSIPFLPSNPVHVDAIPDIGENQQIVFTTWPGRSPQDIEDQISYPLTTSLLGIPGVKSIRSSSVFGFSSVYIIFEDDVEFYWSRSRILEKLNSLPSNLLPDGVQPSLGPDATGLGQVFWYTIEGRNPEGEVTGGWDLHEIRKVQDFNVKYALSAVSGVSEVASIGGFVQEYQIDVDPNALNAYNVSLMQVVNAVRASNRDVGAKTLEINRAEYLVRGLGYVKSISDIENAVVTEKNNVPILVKDLGRVMLGPASRRGVLDKGGAEVVGGVVIARYGANPMEVIESVKQKIGEFSSGLPSKVLSNGERSQLTIVPFYDRTQLINETLGTLEEALSLELLITIIVVIVMILNLRASILISSLLPLSVLMVFIWMKLFNVDANIVALSGIAIAIGTMVDLGIVLSENIIKHIKTASPNKPLKEIIYNGASEVSSAILAAVATTIVSFIPVFTMEAAEGKLFRPLAFTKTMALFSSLIVVLIILPTIANWVFGWRKDDKKGKIWLAVISALIGIGSFIIGVYWAGFSLVTIAIIQAIQFYWLESEKWISKVPLGIVLVVMGWLLAKFWYPLSDKGIVLNVAFVGLILLLIIGFYQLLERNYKSVLTWVLGHKKSFLIFPTFFIVWGLSAWLGFSNLFGFVPKITNTVGLSIENTNWWAKMNSTFPGISKEFMPSLDEGSFLLMPSSMPHAGMAENREVLQKLDRRVSNIPEVDLVVGKMGRAETAIDPAPISMYENIVNYKTEYALHSKGGRGKFKVNDQGEFELSDGRFLSRETMLKQNIPNHLLVEDENGRYFRNWRNHIQSPDDIWKEIVQVTQIPGVTSAPKLQPIETRLVMLQTGMRAPMGIKVYGPDLMTIQNFGIELEDILREVVGVKSEAVFADRIVGKPYLNLRINREKIARYGLSVDEVQNLIEIAIGGMQISSTLEGRERYPIRVRYPRELRNDPKKISEIWVTTHEKTKVQLGQLVDVEYVKGPQMIKSENTFLVGYVLFDKIAEASEVEVVLACQKKIKSAIDSGSLMVPSGVSYKFSGNYENQIRAEKRLSLIIPMVLLVIFLILYFQFKSVTTSLMVFSGVAMAFSGGFIMLWLYGEPWFLDFNVFGTNMRQLFQISPVNLSVAVWVGFIALFGIATDDGVLMGTYLKQNFEKQNPKTIQEIRAAVIEAGQKRIKPAVMTTVTTLIALIPILSSSGKGSDIMIPMAIPAFGGMVVASITFFIVPMLYAFREERKLKINKH